MTELLTISLDVV